MDIYGAKLMKFEKYLKTNNLLPENKIKYFFINEKIYDALHACGSEEAGCRGKPSGQVGGSEFIFDRITGLLRYDNWRWMPIYPLKF